MIGECGSKGVCLVAEVAFPRFFSGMDDFVSPQDGAVRELFEANWTSVRFLASVLSPMLCQIRLVNRFIAANFARVDGHEVLVDVLAVLLDQMLEQHFVRREDFAAKLTLESRIVRMAVQMMYKRSLELESFPFIDNVSKRRNTGKLVTRTPKTSLIKILKKITPKCRLLTKIFYLLWVFNLLKTKPAIGYLEDELLLAALKVKESQARCVFDQKEVILAMRKTYHKRDRRAFSPPHGRPCAAAVCFCEKTKIYFYDGSVW